ncbi:hypothetical protein U9M48_044218 [Paspalum notatum var. saurae]|uniref:peptidylprolyl isomerase n=1 Tax=Paspalum notatum var. saurae TaxID=547442 RepID=A0AAQ3XGE8_PASNO
MREYTTSAPRPLSLLLAFSPLLPFTQRAPSLSCLSSLAGTIRRAPRPPTGAGPFTGEEHPPAKVMAETIDLSGDGGVLKTVVRKAKDDAIAPSDSLPLVDVHYEGTLAENGEVFDTTHEDNSIFSFEVGQGAVIKAWDIALRTMKVGEVAKITCKPEYAYGTAGSPPEIPPNATLVFEVELVACRPRKGSSVGSVSDEKARLEELKKQRELAAATKEEEKKKREEAKAAAAARVQAKLDAKKGKGKGKGK